MNLFLCSQSLPVDLNCQVVSFLFSLRNTFTTSCRAAGNEFPPFTQRCLYFTFNSEGLFFSGYRILG